MILFLNVFITDQGFRKYDRGLLPSSNRGDIFKYSLASLSAINWNHVIIYYDLDTNYRGRRQEIDRYIEALFPNPIIYKYRNDRQWQWQEATRKLQEINDDDLIWFSCDDDHIFIDYDLGLLEILVDKLRKLQQDHEYVSCYFSHWPEMLAYRKKGKLPRKIIEDSDLYFTMRWQNTDGVSIINSKLMEYWWFAHDYGDRTLRRTDDIEVATSPVTVTIIPYRELVRHFDGYSHVGFDINVCPPLFIPPGFFDNDIKIQYGGEQRKKGFILINPMNPNYSTKDEQGADLRCLREEIPLFWQDKIAVIENDGLHPGNARSGRNRALIKLACIDLTRGGWLPWRVAWKIRHASLTDSSGIRILFDALRCWGLRDYKRYLSHTLRENHPSFFRVIRAVYGLLRAS
jgi:hypothetical protein